MRTLAQTIAPFGRWSENHIAADLPVAVSYPAEISKRLGVLRRYLTVGGWPPNIPSEAIDTVRGIVKGMMSDVELEIVQAVRLIAAATIRDDGSRATDVRDEVLSVFLASKMLATARALMDHMLIGEPPLEWGEEFCELKPIFSPRLILGLAFIARSFLGWAGWTNADLHLGDNRYRLFAPICPEPERESTTLSQGEVRRVIIPQLLGTGKSLSYETIGDLLFKEAMQSERDLILRYEIFIDAQTCSDHRNAKAYIERIAADRIISRLLEMPTSERWHKFILMTLPINSSLEVVERVKDKVSFD